MEKLSSDQIVKVKQANVNGFVNHMLAAGKSEQAITTTYKRASARVGRQEKIAGIIRDSLK